jgi:hypothetical protein
LVTVTDQGECISEPLGVIAYQSQQLDMKWVLRAANGSPIDLTGCVPSSVVMRMQEGATRLGTVVEAACTINDRVKGGITLTIPAASMTKPGVYELQFALSLPLDVETNVVRFINRGYLIIENSLFADTADQGSLGPPLVSEILMGVRSGDPSRSDLLREKEWNLSEIAQALIQPVEFWNDALPPVEYYFSTTDFTFRHAWRGAAIALLREEGGGILLGTDNALSLTGSLTPTGSTVKAVADPRTASLTPTGAATKSDASPKTGSTTPTGSAVKAVADPKTGSTTPTGATVKAAGKPQTGSVAPTGAKVAAVGAVKSGSILRPKKAGAR